MHFQNSLLVPNGAPANRRTLSSKTKNLAGLYGVCLWGEIEIIANRIIQTPRISRIRNITYHARQKQKQTTAGIRISIDLDRGIAQPPAAARRRRRRRRLASIVQLTRELATNVGAAHGAVCDGS